MENKKKKFNWTRFIMVFSTLIVIGAIVGAFAFKSNTQVSFGEFQTSLKEASESTTDNKYFKQIRFDQHYLKIYVQENGKADYKVSVPTTASFDGLVTKLGVVYRDSFIVNNNDFFNKAIIGTEYSKPSIWLSIFMSMLPLLLYLGVGLAIFAWFKKNNKGGGIGPNFPWSKGNNSKAKKIISDKRFSDVAGNVEVKEEVMELVDYLRNPNSYKAAGARIPKGILLGGPPGTGKTLIAKATAGESGVPFYFISGSNFVEVFVGLGAKRVRSMFRDARKNSPCIIFIDEIDAVGRSRSSSMGGSNDEREQTLNQLLVEMDGMEENAGILVIAATNRPDVLDRALQRPGRFDRTITVGLPDIKEREAILRVHAKGKRIDKTIDFSKIAKRTPGYSGAQLENVINESALLSVREKTRIMTPKQVDEAIDRVMSGPAKKSRVISKEELTMVSLHEAGHAVIGIKVPGGQKVQKITIIPRGQAGGYNLMTPEKETYNYKKSELYAKIMSFMGGRAAEQIIYGKGEVSTGSFDDIQKATNIARRMVTQWGMSDELGPIQYEQEQNDNSFLSRGNVKNKDFSDKVGYEIDTVVREIMIKAEKDAINIIKNNIKLLKNISNALLEKETIVAEEIEYIAKYGKIPEIKKTQKNKNKKEDSLKDLIANVKKQQKTTKNKKQE